MFWVDLGEPSFSLSRAKEDVFGFAQGGLNAFLFVFGNQYRAVQDRRLTFLVWLVRISFALGFVAVLLQFAYGP
jgi:hypothetical protein